MKKKKKSEGWEDESWEGVCVIWREEDEVEEETKSREKKKREQEGLPVLLFFHFFVFFISAGAEGAPQGQNTHVTVPYGHTPVTPWSIPPWGSDMILYGVVIHPHSLFCGCSALRYWTSLRMATLTSQSAGSGCPVARIATLANKIRFGCLFSGNKWRWWGLS